MIIAIIVVVILEKGERGEDRGKRRRRRRNDDWTKEWPDEQIHSEANISLSNQSDRYIDVYCKNLSTILYV